MNLTQTFTSIKKIVTCTLIKYMDPSKKNLSPWDPGQNKFLITLCRNLERAFRMWLENRGPVSPRCFSIQYWSYPEPFYTYMVSSVGVASRLIQHPLLSSRMDKMLACFGLMHRQIIRKRSAYTMKWNVFSEIESITKHATTVIDFLFLVLKMFYACYFLFLLLYIP